VVDDLTELRQSIALRPAEPRDADLLRTLFASTRVEELALVPWTDEEKAAFVEQQFTAQDRYYRQVYPGGRFDVIERDGHPIGRWYVAELADELRLVEVTILPEERGRGVGTALVTGLCEEADRRGLAVRLHVEPWNPARRLYERFGFVSTGESGGIYELMERPAAALPAVS
jgi:ribosomal protein S18 acetylase RimI-like enzyme